VTERFRVRRRAALGAFSFAAASLAVPAAADRLVSQPGLYRTASDLIVHLAAELLCGLLVGAVLWGFFALIATTEQRWPRRARLIRGGTLLAVSCAASFAVYFLIVCPSVFLGLFRGREWLSMLAIPCILLVAGLHAVIGRLVGVHPRLLSIALLLVAWGLLVFGQHQFLYLNVIRHAALLTLSAVAAALAGAVVGSCLSRSHGQSLFQAAIVVALAAALALHLLPASHAARSVVLRQGGLARHVTTLALWPVADSDGDSIPRGRFFGLDPDDRDHRVTPLSVVLGQGRRPPVPLQEVARPAGAAGGLTNLLWIIVDTVGMDTFKDIVKRDPPVREAFSRFAFLENYASCSSRTDQTMQGLFGEAGCRGSHDQFDNRGLARQLESLGYENTAVVHYVKFMFRRTAEYSDDTLVLQHFYRLMRRASARPQFMLMHLKGGHTPYDGVGTTDRSKHENAIADDLRAVARLVQDPRFRDWTVVVMGDHGEAFGEHGNDFHSTTLYEEVLRTPLLIRSSRHAPGTISTVAGCLDVQRQVLFALGLLPSDPGFAGFQFATLKVPAGILGQLVPLSLRSLRRGDTKIIWEPRLDIVELYDLASDPQERRNLADAFPTRLAAAKQDLMDVLGSCEADQP
jgi:hypothetical protein